MNECSSWWSCQIPANTKVTLRANCSQKSLNCNPFSYSSFLCLPYITTSWKEILQSSYIGVLKELSQTQHRELKNNASTVSPKWNHSRFSCLTWVAAPRLMPGVIWTVPWSVMYHRLGCQPGCSQEVVEPLAGEAYWEASLGPPEVSTFLCHKVLPQLRQKTKWPWTETSETKSQNNLFLL